MILSNERAVSHLDSGVGEITRSRFKHCLRYSRRLQLKYMDPLALGD